MSAVYVHGRSGEDDMRQPELDDAPETGMEEHWVTLAKELWEENQKRSKRVDESINSLLLFAGLFSAVQTAFVVATYPSLLDAPASAADIITNVFLFCSLALSLLCAFVGILRKDDLKRYLLPMEDTIGTARDRVCWRQSTFERDTEGKLWNSADQLSRGLVCSIGSFSAGILILLWTLNWFVALTVLVFVCVAPDLFFPGRGVLWFLQYVFVKGILWLAEVKRTLAQNMPYSCSRLRTWLWGINLYKYLPRPVSRTGDNSDFNDLLRAILPRFSMMIHADSSSNTGFRCLLGLARLPDTRGGHQEWQVLASDGHDAEDGGLRRVVNLFLAILKQQVPCKGVPSSLRTRLRRCWNLILGKYVHEMRPVARDSLAAAATVYPWVTWITPAIVQLRKGNHDGISHSFGLEIMRTLRAIESAQETDIPFSKETWFAAFCLAQKFRECLFLRDGSSKRRIYQAWLVAGVQLHTHDRQFLAHRDAGCLDRDHKDGQRADDILHQLVISLLRSEAKTFPRRGMSIYDSDKTGSYDPDAEFVTNMLLRAAVGVDPPALSLLDPLSHWDSASAIIIVLCSLHGLRALKTLGDQSPAVASTLRPQVISVGLRLTDLLQHDVLVCHLFYRTVGVTNPDITTQFPWFFALEHFVDCMPAKMGSLLRCVVEMCQEHILDVTEDQLSSFVALAAMFPVDEAADDQLRLVLSQLACTIFDYVPENQACGPEPNASTVTSALPSTNSPVETLDLAAGQAAGPAPYVVVDMHLTPPRAALPNHSEASSDRVHQSFDNTSGRADVQPHTETAVEMAPNSCHHRLHVASIDMPPDPSSSPTAVPDTDLSCTFPLNLPAKEPYQPLRAEAHATRGSSAFPRKEDPPFQPYFRYVSYTSGSGGSNQFGSYVAVRRDTSSGHFV